MTGISYARLKMLGRELNSVYQKYWASKSLVENLADKLWQGFDRRQALDHDRVSKILSNDALMRFAYVPFVIASLAWDYIDTILVLSAAQKKHETKRLCRAVRQLKSEYDRLRAPYIDKDHQSSEEVNMLVFENGVKDIFNLYLVNIAADLKREYPNLDDDSLVFLKAVYQAHIVLLSIYKYVNKQTSIVEKLLNEHIRDILPSQLRRVDGLVMAFVGDKPISEQFAKEQESYAQILCNRMLKVELIDKENKSEMQ